MRWFQAAACAAAALLICTVGLGQKVPADANGGGHNLLARARKFVDESPRYLHHSRLKPGMEGYGLTVLKGTEIVRFRAVIESVMDQWGPNQSVILARLSEHGLEGTKIISGMSGSPVYMRDPRDGKYKMIGAVAYGWMAQNEPLCGIQPITQMLAVSGVLNEPGGEDQPASPARPAGTEAADDAGRSTDRPGPTAESGAASGTASGPGAGAASGASAGAASPASPAWRDGVFQPDPREFLDWLGETWTRRAAAGQRQRGALARLPIPVMISGQSQGVVAAAGELLRPAGFLPVRAGGTGAADANAAADVKLEPGSAVSIPLVLGDADWSAVGTVTDVLDGRVLAFGHSFFAAGEADFPMATGYIHTVVSGLLNSFKLGSTVRITGRMDRDEVTAIGGMIGEAPEMIPLSIHIRWADDDRTQRLQYRVCKDEMFTPILPQYMVSEALFGWRTPHRHHVIRYEVDVDFGPAGRYAASNVTTDSGGWSIMSDLSRPIAAMVSNPLAEPLYPRRAEVRAVISRGQIGAVIVSADLHGEVYQPGDTLRGTVTLERFRRSREKLAFRFDLPDDLPDGKYSLTLCDASRAMSLTRSAQPHLFDPRTREQLMTALQMLSRMRNDRLHMRLETPTEGLAVGHRDLPDLPPSRREMLLAADLVDTVRTRTVLDRTMDTEYVLSGAGSVTFEVSRQPRELPVGGQNGSARISDPAARAGQAAGRVPGRRDADRAAMNEAKGSAS